jgi:hypothetical protein
MGEKGDLISYRRRPFHPVSQTIEAAARRGRREKTKDSGSALGDAAVSPPLDLDRERRRRAGDKGDRREGRVRGRRNAGKRSRRGESISLYI